MKPLICILAFSLAAACCAGQTIDNSNLLPKYKPDAEVKMESRADGSLETPDWIKSLIMVEVRVDSASTDETLKGMGKALDHLAEIGVNGIWVNPPLNEGNGYGNFGIHTISARLTGEKEPAKQWQVLRNFVEEAHKRNIRVFFDVVTWGATKHEGGAKLYQEKPEWFGEYFAPYAGKLFNWENKELNEWFSSRLVEWLLMTGADGFRCDCAPMYSGFEPYAVAKKRMRDFGRKVVFIAEWTTTGKGVFDLDQLTFCYKSPNNRRVTHWLGDVYLKRNIVDGIQSGDELNAYDDMQFAPGTKRFYTYMLSCHDSKSYLVKGDPIAIGYQAILAPFIPLWFLGEEWNNSPKLFLDFYCKRDNYRPKTISPYHVQINWEEKEKNREFFESVKKMIRIRRSYPEIFEYFPDNHRNSNICKVTTDRDDLLQAYARFRNGTAVLVVPNNSTKPAKLQISIPFRAASLNPRSEYAITDLMNDQKITSGKLLDFQATIPAGNLGVYLVEPLVK